MIMSRINFRRDLHEFFGPEKVIFSFISSELANLAIGLH